MTEEFHKKKRTVWLQQAQHLIAKVTLHRLDINLNTWNEHYAFASTHKTANEAKREYFWGQSRGHDGDAVARDFN